jgi:hypothetical protein
MTERRRRLSGEGGTVGEGGWWCFRRKIEVVIRVLRGVPVAMRTFVLACIGRVLDAWGSGSGFDEALWKTPRAAGMVVRRRSI